MLSRLFRFRTCRTDLIGRPEITIIDLREKSERARHGEITCAMHLPYSDWQESIAPGGALRLLAEATNETLLFYCAFGERSAMAVQAAQDAGLKTVRHIEGGIDAWKKAGGKLIQPGQSHCSLSRHRSRRRA